MDIPKAIEILQDISRTTYIGAMTDEHDAINLAIQGFKLLLLLRANFRELGLNNLPGETQRRTNDSE